MWTAALLLVVGIFLSAFFSGSETGFYRASRVRLVLDGLEGDWRSRFLLWLTNRPAMFVATTLVGNNVANYLTSLAIVLAAQLVYGSGAYTAELLAPVLFAPLVFVYGELMPKNLFFQAPNRLLHRATPLLLVFTVLFIPISALLGTLGHLLERLLGQSPGRVRLALARKELSQVLVEGEDVGLLYRTQRHLAQNFFSVAGTPLGKLCMPLSRVASLADGMTVQQALPLAAKARAAALPVRDAARHFVGYVRVADLVVEAPATAITSLIQPLDSIPGTKLCAEVLLRMQSNRQEMCNVVDQQGRLIGIIDLQSLIEPLMSGPAETTGGLSRR